MSFLLKIYLIIVAETIFETTLLNVIVNETHKKMHNLNLIVHS